jgi:protein-S-isoprenylcysteine O-methyltransferase Ste14
MALLLKNLLFTIIIPGTVAVYVPLSIARTRQPATGFASAFALVLLVVGSAIYAWCIWDFATFGRGTPAPIDAPKRLVVRGLYRYSRNPMYVGVLTVIFGWVVLFQANALVIYALIVGLCFHCFVVFYEEPHLQRSFGKEYVDYCTRVGRWLPRLRRPSA